MINWFLELVNRLTLLYTAILRPEDRFLTELKTLCTIGVKIALIIPQNLFLPLLIFNYLRFSSFLSVAVYVLRYFIHYTYPVSYTHLTLPTKA